MLSVKMCKTSQQLENTHRNGEKVGNNENVTNDTEAECEYFNIGSSSILIQLIKFDFLKKQRDLGALNMGNHTA